MYTGAYTSVLHVRQVRRQLMQQGSAAVSSVLLRRTTTTAKHLIEKLEVANQFKYIII